MFSLLPPRGYLMLYSEARARRAVVVLLAALLVFLFGMAMLTPAFIESRLEVPILSPALKMFAKERAPRSNTASAANAPDASPATNLMYEIESTAPILLSIATDTAATTDFLSLLVSVRESFLNHADVSIAHIAASDLGMSISGTARSRATLLVLNEQLRKDKHFSSVNFPFSSLTGKDGAYPFIFTCTLASSSKEKTQKSTLK